jgi:hypothetical protein
MISTARGFIHRPGNDVESDRGAEGVNKLVGCRGAVEILHDDGQLIDGEGERHAQQGEEHHGKHQREREGAPVADDLGEFLSCLRDDSSHACRSSLLDGDFAL